MVRQILGRLIRGGLRPRRREEQGTCSILSRETFERELERLRAYANRTGAPFVLLRLGVMSAGTETRRRDAATDLLAEVVRARVRLSDTVGWCEEKGRLLGIILCGTQSSGAEAVYRAIRSAYQERIREGSAAGAPSSDLMCDICRYPAEVEPPAASEGDAGDRRPEGT